MSQGVRLSAWIRRVLFATGHGQSEAAQDEKPAVKERRLKLAVYASRWLIAATTTAAVGSPVLKDE
eukprot:scaffold117849_cov115-Phaeocystis_antarctica.AAC.1